MALVPVHRRVTYFWRAFFGGVFLFCAFAALVIVVFAASLPKESVEKARAEARAQKLAALRAEDAVKLTGYKWANKQKGTVAIPIDRAMELVLADLKMKTPHPSSVKVENPYPVGLQDAAVAAPAVSGTAAEMTTALKLPPASNVPVVNSAASPSPTPTLNRAPGIEKGMPPVPLQRPLSTPFPSPLPSPTAANPSAGDLAAPKTPPSASSNPKDSMTPAPALSAATPLPAPAAPAASAAAATPAASAAPARQPLWNWQSPPPGSPTKP